jgi:hypothetical protein
MLLVPALKCYLRRGITLDSPSIAGVISLVEAANSRLFEASFQVRDGRNGWFELLLRRLRADVLRDSGLYVLSDFFMMTVSILLPVMREISTHRVMSNPESMAALAIAVVLLTIMTQSHMNTAEADARFWPE